MMATMNQSTLRASALLVISIAFIAAGYLYQNHQHALAMQTNAKSAATTSSATFAALTKSAVESGSTRVVPFTDGQKATVTYKAPTIPMALQFTAKLSPAEKHTLQSGYALAFNDIAKDKLDFNAWINVGTLNFMAGNYETAKQVWQYTSAQWPSNHASHNNLGELYMSYLKDYPKAEKEFLAAIVNKPDDTNPYRNLFTLYSETSYKPSNSAAEDILKKAIAANPRAVDMQYTLAVYLKKLGRTDEAMAMFQAAIDNATKQGQTQLAAQIKTDAGIK